MRATKSLSWRSVPDDRAAFDACLREGRTLAEVAARSASRGVLREFVRRLPLTHTGWDAVSA